MRLLVIVCVSLLASCQEAAYPYRHYQGCTGVCIFLEIQGKTVPIDFSPRSNQERLGALNALGSNIYVPNAVEGGRLFLVGTLHEYEFCSDPDPDVAPDPTWMNDPFRFFDLSDWFLVAPFAEQEYVDHPVDGPPIWNRKTRNTLEARDFEKPVADPSRYVRPSLPTKVDPPSWFPESNQLREASCPGWIGQLLANAENRLSREEVVEGMKRNAEALAPCFQAAEAKHDGSGAR